MNNFNSDCLSDFIKCKSIWFLFLTELNWNPSAINPLELVPESFWPEVTDLLIEARYIGQSRNYYLKESDKYMDCLLYTSPSPRDRTRSRMPSSA